MANASVDNTDRDDLNVTTLGWTRTHTKKHQLALLRLTQHL